MLKEAILRSITFQVSKRVLLTARFAILGQTAAPAGSYLFHSQDITCKSLNRDVALAMVHLIHQAKTSVDK